MSLATPTNNSISKSSVSSTKLGSNGPSDVKKDKPKQVRDTNISAAKALGDAIRTSLGPRGMDKMIIGSNRGVTISNDGATILKEMQVMHPVAKMLVDLSKAQDIEAGDGTTSVVVLACSLLDAASKLLTKGIHPTAISEGFQLACDEAIKVVESIATKVDLEDREALVKSAATSLSSKVVSQYSDVLSEISVDAVLALIPDKKSTQATCVDLNDIKIVKKLGGTIEDTELVTDGVVLTQSFSNKLESGSSSVKLENAKVGLIQFCISPPKTDMDSSVIVTDYTQMDRVLREERQYILKICKEIQKSGCNVLLIQKSILRDAINDVGLHFLSKMNVHVIKNVEREQVDHICKTLGCKPVSSVDQLNSSNLATVKLVEELSTGTERYVKMTGVKTEFQSASIIVRGSNNLVIEEADRSLHDALCVVRSIVKGRHLIVGGGAAETEISLALESYSKKLVGANSLCVKYYGEAMDIIPSTLAENAGFNAVKIMTELKKTHLNGVRTAGIDIKRGSVKDMATEDVVQPLLVTTSALTLATETVRCILKIDDMLQVVR